MGVDMLKLKVLVEMMVTIQLNCSANSHGVKIKSPPHSAAATYTLTLPTNIVNGQFLKTDGSGNLSWAASGTASRTTTNASTGSIAQTASANITIPTPGKTFFTLKGCNQCTCICDFIY